MIADKNLTVDLEEGVAVVKLSAGRFTIPADATVWTQLPNLLADLAQRDLRGIVLVPELRSLDDDCDQARSFDFDAIDPEATFKAIERVKSALRTLESSDIAVVATLDGDCQGAGLEVALACKRRFATAAARFAMGQTQYGLVPALGGISRLTRLVGYERALDMLIRGKKLTSGEAKDIGLVDEVCKDRAEVLSRCRQWIHESGQTAADDPWENAGPIPGGDIDSVNLAAVIPYLPLKLAAEKFGLQPALEASLVVATEALRLDMDTSQKVESRKFLEVLRSGTARNMLEGGFVDRVAVDAGKSRPADVPPRTFAMIGVIGAGMMGTGIAHVAAKAGTDVILRDVSKEGAEMALQRIADQLDLLVNSGRLSAKERNDILSRIYPTGPEGDLSRCELVIEAVFEDIALKHRLIREIESGLDSQTIWGTNTSMLPISRLAQGSIRPGNFIGIHFFSPVERMELVELICGEQTSDAALAGAFDFVRQIGKTAIVVNDSLGFYTSRTFATQLMEGARLIMDGVHPLMIDAAGREAGMPVGPLTVSDEISLKLIVDVRETQRRNKLVKLEEEDQPEAYEFIKSLVEKDKRIGRISGAGYYDYHDGKRTIWPELVARYARDDHGIPPEDVRDRILFRAVVEALRCYAEGVLNTVADGNAGSLLGIGAPPHTGGYLQFPIGYGPERFRKRCEVLQSKYGDRFACPDVIGSILASRLSPT